MAEVDPSDLYARSDVIGIECDSTLERRSGEIELAPREVRPAEALVMVGAAGLQTGPTTRQKKA